MRLIAPEFLEVMTQKDLRVVFKLLFINKYYEAKAYDDNNMLVIYFLDTIIPERKAELKQQYDIADFDYATALKNTIGLSKDRLKEVRQHNEELRINLSQIKKRYEKLVRAEKLYKEFKEKYN